MAKRAAHASTGNGGMKQGRQSSKLEAYDPAEDGSKLTVRNDPSCSQVFSNKLSVKG